MRQWQSCGDTLRCLLLIRPYCLLTLVKLVHHFVVYIAIINKQQYARELQRYYNGVQAMLKPESSVNLSSLQHSIYLFGEAASKVALWSLFSCDRLLGCYGDPFSSRELHSILRITTTE